MDWRRLVRHRTPQGRYRSSCDSTVARHLPRAGRSGPPAPVRLLDLVVGHRLWPHDLHDEEQGDAEQHEPGQDKDQRLGEWPCFMAASGEVPTTVASAAPSTAAIHFAESRRRVPALLQHSCIPASAGPCSWLSSAGRAGQAGQITPSGSQPSLARSHRLLSHQMSRMIREPSLDNTTRQQADDGSRLVLAARSFPLLAASVAAAAALITLVIVVSLAAAGGKATHLASHQTPGLHFPGRPVPRAPTPLASRTDARAEARTRPPGCHAAISGNGWQSPDSDVIPFKSSKAGLSGDAERVLNSDLQAIKQYTSRTNTDVRVIITGRADHARHPAKSGQLAQDPAHAICTWLITRRVPSADLGVEIARPPSMWAYGKPGSGLLLFQMSRAIIQVPSACR